MRTQQTLTTALTALAVAAALGTGSSTPARAAQPDARPVAVSPGSGTGSLIGDSCPTFSWGAVSGARSYELVVYRVEDSSQEARPVLERSFPGSVTTWTPSLESCLARGARYAWNVRAVGQDQPSDWSPLNIFQVAAGPSEADFEAALATVQAYLATRAGRGVVEPGRVGPTEEPAGRNEAEPGSFGSPEPLVRGAPATVSLVTEGAIGVGTPAPLADLHVVGGPVSGGLLLTPNEPADGGLSEIFLGEDDDGSFGMKLRYDGGLDVLQVRGHENVDLGAWLTIERNTGAATFGGVITGDGSGLTSVSAETADALANDPAACPPGEVVNDIAADGTVFCVPDLDSDTFVTNKDAHDHLGGDGATVQHSSLGSVGASDHHVRYTDSEALAAVGPGSAAMGQLALCDGVPGGWRWWDLGDGTVLDCNTRRIWLKDASCLGTDDWSDVFTKVADLNGGTDFGCSGYTPGTYTDWEVPTMETMCGLWNGSCSGTSCCTASQGLIDVSVSGSPKVANGKGDARWTPGDVFVGVQSNFYWSATEFDALRAWFVLLTNGNVVNDYKYPNFYVWPVRVGQ